MQTKGITEPNDVSVGSAVYEAFFATITLLLQHKVPLIAEAAFQHRLWYPRLGPLREIAEIKILVCSLDAQRAAERGIARGQADPQRRQFHDEALFHRALQGDESPENPYRPPILPVPTLPVDTSDGYQPSLAEIVRFVRSGT